MSLNILAQGAVIADPIRRKTAKEAIYATATLRVATEDGPILVSAIAFDADAVSTLLGLSKGDSVAVCGRSKLTTWSGHDGESRHGISVTVDRVIAAKPRARRDKIERAGADFDFENF